MLTYKDQWHCSRLNHARSLAFKSERGSCIRGYGFGLRFKTLGSERSGRIVSKLVATCSKSNRPLAK